MRIDSITGANSWLQGNFKGKFKGHLEGTADSAYCALTASYALTGSYMDPISFGKALDKALDDPANKSVFEKLRSSGKLNVQGGILIQSGNLEINTGSLRVGRAVAEYLPEEDALQFTFKDISSGDTGSSGSGSVEEPTGSVDCDCCHCCLSGSCPFRPPFPPPPPKPWPGFTPCGKCSPSIDQFPGIGYQG